MSHNIRHFTYKENVDRRAVQAECDHLAAMDDWQEGCSGVNPIRWIESTICDSYEEAEKEIQFMDKGWYDCLAIRYRETHTMHPASKTLLNASNRVNEAQKAYNELSDKVKQDFFSRKSALVGCKNCNSKLNPKFLANPKCPCCGNSLLSTTAQDRLERAKERIKTAQKAQQEISARLLKKESAKGGEIKWLVKIEYHT